MQVHKKLAIGLDVGSTTVKAVVVDPETKAILWKKYQRHETKQPELVKEFLDSITKAFPKVDQGNWRLFVTGSGGGTLAPMIGAKFVHEVNAVTLAVEELHPDAGSVIELGGQDAKIIIWKVDPVSNKKQIFSSMNDKCAGGTGATIDKIVAKVGISNEKLGQISFDDSSLHHVAGKCGVFAETDVVNLLKSSVPADEIMISLADAIIKQNVSVLTRGNTLRDKVLLLGGPNTYLPFLQQGWRKRICEIWEERNWTLPKGVDPESLIIVPDNAQYYAAFGTVVFGLEESEEDGYYKGIEELADYINVGRKNKLSTNGSAKGLIKSQEEYETFKKLYTIPLFEEPCYKKDSLVQGVIGVDGGSTSTKAVLMDLEGNLLTKVYQLSNGNPIQDTKEILATIRKKIEEQGAVLEVVGFGTTGYASDILDETMSADVKVVETVAHMRSAMHYFGDTDIIVDVGGQDIKVLFMEHGHVKDFKLNTQCSAGNGYFLQGMASQFGINVTDYADYAFKADIAPIFNYGCAVFMEQDKVNFQQLGWQKEELMAGLALVLPQNIWQYVVQEPNLKKYGRRYVLQGGTQYNLAAVKAQVDYIVSKVPDAQVNIHPHTGVAGAIGACLEAIKTVKQSKKSRFIGIDEAIGIQYTTKTNEETRCYFCPNHCSRTFIDTVTPSGKRTHYISGFACEKGVVESKEALHSLNLERIEIKKKYANLVDYAAKQAFRAFHPRTLDDAPLEIEEEQTAKGLFKSEKKLIKRPFKKANQQWLDKRRDLRIGIPKALNIYSTAPFWRTYFEALGIPSRHIIFSDFTSDEMYSHGAKWGSIDPCFPSKVAVAHVHNLLFKKSSDKYPLDIIFFPMLTHIHSQLANTMNNSTCPVVAGSPEVVKAAFTREKDIFKENNVIYCNPYFKMDEENLFMDQLLKAFESLLGITEDENRFAYFEAKKALEDFDRLQKEKGRQVLDSLEKSGDIGILALGRPYHNDPGLNHDILEYLQTMGYPILSLQSLPIDDDTMNKLFEEDLESGKIKDPLEINDVWKHTYSVNSSLKLWGAKFAAKHPNLAVVDLSNFKCGHDSPIYHVIDKILATTKTPHFNFHDIDENKPTGSIKIRTKTIQYFLNQYMLDLKNDKADGSKDSPVIIKESSIGKSDNLQSNKEKLTTVKS